MKRPGQDSKPIYQKQPYQAINLLLDTSVDTPIADRSVLLDMTKAPWG
jgi:hypothetical protein